MNPGKYQQYVNELPDFELYRYENIFKVFETENNNYLYYNILKTVKILADCNVLPAASITGLKLAQTAPLK